MAGDNGIQLSHGRFFAVVFYHSAVIIVTNRAVGDRVVAPDLSGYLNIARDWDSNCGNLQIGNGGKLYVSKNRNFIARRFYAIIFRIGKFFGAKDLDQKFALPNARREADAKLRLAELITETWDRTGNDSLWHLQLNKYTFVNPDLVNEIFNNAKFFNRKFMAAVQMQVKEKFLIGNTSAVREDGQGIGLLNGILGRQLDNLDNGHRKNVVKLFNFLVRKTAAGNKDYIVDGDVVSNMNHHFQTMLLLGAAEKAETAEAIAEYLYDIETSLIGIAKKIKDNGPDYVSQITELTAKLCCVHNDFVSGPGRFLQDGDAGNDRQVFRLVCEDASAGCNAWGDESAEMFSQTFIDAIESVRSGNDEKTLPPRSRGLVGAIKSLQEYSKQENHGLRLSGEGISDGALANPEILFELGAVSNVYRHDEASGSKRSNVAASADEPTDTGAVQLEPTDLHEKITLGVLQYLLMKKPD